NYDLHILFFRLCRYGPALLQRSAIDPRDLGSRQSLASGHVQSRFCQTVTWVKGLGVEAARNKNRGKPFHGFRMYRLGAVESDFPTAQVQPGALFGRDCADAKIVGKIRSTRDGRSYLSDRLQPTERLLQESERRKNDHRKADEQRLDHAADQSHIVVGRQPGDAHTVAVALKPARNQLRIM